MCVSPCCDAISRFALLLNHFVAGQAGAWAEMSSWMADQDLGQEAASELITLLAEAAPGLGLFATSSPSARRTSSRKRSVEASAQLRSRLKAAVPMPTGECPSPLLL